MKIIIAIGLGLALAIAAVALSGFILVPINRLHERWKGDKLS